MFAVFENATIAGAAVPKTVWTADVVSFRSDARLIEFSAVPMPVEMTSLMPRPTAKPTPVRMLAPSTPPSTSVKPVTNLRPESLPAVPNVDVTRENADDSRPPDTAAVFAASATDSFAAESRLLEAVTASCVDCSARSDAARRSSARTTCTESAAFFDRADARAASATRTDPAAFCSFSRAADSAEAVFATSACAAFRPELDADENDCPKPLPAVAPDFEKPVVNREPAEPTVPSTASATALRKPLNVGKIAT